MRIFALIITTLCCAGFSSTLLSADSNAILADIAPHQSMIDGYCLECHNLDDFEGGFAFDLMNLQDIGVDAEFWEKVVKKIRGSYMPPVGQPRPDSNAYIGFVEWLEDGLDREALAGVNPGRPGLYRLNRTEYATVIRDMLGMDIDIEAILPPDNSSYGFDNIASILGVSTTLLEGYLAAADRVSAIAVGDPEFAAEEAHYPVSNNLSQDEYIEGLPLGTRGGVLIEHNFPLDAIYEINTRFVGNSVDAIRGLQFPHQFEIAIDGKRVRLVTIGGSMDYNMMMENSASSKTAIEKRTSLRLPVKAGKHIVTVAFIEKTGALELFQLQPLERLNFDPVNTAGIPSVSHVTIRGPFNGQTPSGETASRRAIFSCSPGQVSEELSCAREILSKVSRSAYRRPITGEDLDVLVDFYQIGRETKGNFEGGIQMALRRILMSPDFLFRIERDPADVAPGETFAISDLELASRLSFFLWSSVPDDELINLASASRLRDPEILEQQVNRMLADERSQALVDNFAGQWLQLRNLASVEPDLLAFPNFDENLRRAFYQETSLFFESIMREDRNVTELMTADYTFLNERLARHYDIPNVYGDDFRRVQLTNEARRGLLGQGSILTVTSYAHRTSPVIRGKWILETIIGIPPAPPPDDVPALTENAVDSIDILSMRERLAEHRENPACAGCHNMMDPIGLAMERFDGIGRWRDVDEGGLPIDSSGQLANGTDIDGPIELRQAIMARPELFVESFIDKMLTYAIGRGLEYYDMPTIRGIADRAGESDYRFSVIVQEIVKSPQFQMKRAALSEEEGLNVAQQ